MRKMTRSSATLSEDRGFYVILFLCLAAIAIAGYVLFFTPAGSKTEPLDTAVYEPTVTPGDMQPVLGQPDDTPVTTDDSAAAAASAETTAPASATDDTQAATAAASAAADDAAQEALAQPSAPAFVRPVAGDLSEPFSGDELVYQQTFGDWRTHAGADYSAELGARVYAITDGKVSAVSTDALYGTCVTLDHADGLETIYKGLSAKVKVKEGDRVKAGDVLGTVDDTNVAEASEGPHLHVEAIQNGTHIDPETLLSQE